MKPTLFILALFITTCVSAQKYEFGFNGGINYTTKVENVEYNPTIYGQPAKPFSTPLTASIKLLRNHMNWQYGVSIEVSEAEYKVIPPIHYTCILRYSPSPYDYHPYYGLYRSKYYPVKFLLNRKFKSGSFQNYAGINAGYVFLSKAGSTDLDMVLPFVRENYYGLTTGLQVGTTKYIGHHFGINAEFDANYLRFRQGFHYLTNFFTYSFNMGVRYRI